MQGRWSKVAKLPPVPALNNRVAKQDRCQ